MNTAQLTPRAQAVIDDSDEYTAPIFRAPSVGCSGNCAALKALYPMVRTPWTEQHVKNYPRKAASIINAALGFGAVSTVEDEKLRAERAHEVEFKRAAIAATAATGEAS
jgi:hypothetical protein